MDFSQLTCRLLNPNLSQFHCFNVWLDIATLQMLIQCSQLQETKERLFETLQRARFLYYNSVSTLSLSILSDLDEVRQTKLVHLAPTVNNQDIEIVECLAGFVAVVKCYLGSGHQSPRHTACAAYNIYTI